MKGDFSMKIVSALLKPLSFVPALCLMYLIFSFSAQDGATSSQLSYKVSYKIVETGGKILGEPLEPWEIDSIATRFHGIVRKLAHMTEYFALAVSVAFPLYVYGLRGIWLMLVAGFFCVAFACGDEYHQSFVAGRGPSKRDVLIDSFGVFWGIVLVRIVGWTGRKTLFRPFSRDHINRKKKRQEKNGEYPGQPYPEGGYQNPPHQNGGNPPYQNAGYQNSPYQGSGYQNSGYQNQPYQGNGYPNGGYQNPPYQGGGYPSQPYPNGGNPNQPYQNGAYPNQPYPNGGYPNPPYQDRPPYASADEEDYVSDKLAEDMSLRRLMHNIKEQKTEARREHVATRRYAKKKPVDGVEIDEIDLDEEESEEPFDDDLM